MPTSHNYLLSPTSCSHALIFRLSNSNTHAHKQAIQGYYRIPCRKEEPRYGHWGDESQRICAIPGELCSVPRERARETPPELGKETSSAVRSCTTWHSRHWRLLYRRLVAILAHTGERVLTLRVSYFCPPVICDTELFRARNTGGAIYTLAVHLWNRRR